MKEDDSFKIMADFLMIILIIFLLILATLALDVGNKIKVISQANTFSGGKIRPSLVVNPTIFENGMKIFGIYKKSDITSAAEIVDVEGLKERDLLSFLSFVDPGKIEFEGKKYDLLEIQPFQSIVSFKSRLPDGTVGRNAPELIDELRDVAFGGHEVLGNDSFYLSSAHITERAKVYYMSSESDGMQEIIVGHFVIRLSEENSLFMMTALATPQTDFIYLGAYDRGSIVNFFKLHRGLEAVDYYQEWIKGSEKASIPPFMKYSEIAKQFIKEKRALNLKPPAWVRKQFLDKIGATLKVTE